jgi:hypothetical protein
MAQPAPQAPRVNYGVVSTLSALHIMLASTTLPLPMKQGCFVLPGMIGKMIPPYLHKNVYTRHESIMLINGISMYFFAHFSGALGEEDLFREAGTWK